MVSLNNVIGIIRRRKNSIEIEIFGNSTLKNLGVMRGSFLGFGCPKRHPGALLAKTMRWRTDEKRRKINS